MNKQTMKTFWLGAVSMLSTLCLCALVIVTASGDCLSVAALDGTSSTTTTVHCFKTTTQVKKDFVMMRVGQTRAITFYHPETLTATGVTIYDVSDNVAYTYEEGSNTVYVTALEAGVGELSILADGCTEAADVFFFIESDTVTTTVCGWDLAPEDINYDGFINMMDVLQLYANVSTGEGSMTWGGPLGDMNDDYVVNMMDVLLLYARISGGGVTYD